MAEKKYDKMWEMARKTVEARRAKKGKSGAPSGKVGKAFMDKMAKRTDFKKDGSKRITSMEGADYYMSKKAPKGMHRMPNGKLMKDSDMDKKGKKK